MNLAPLSPTTPLPEIPREPGDSSLPEAAEDFANMLSLISLAPVTPAQPQPPVPTPAPNSPEVTLPVQSDASQIVPTAINVADTVPGLEDSGSAEIEPETGSLPPVLPPDVALRKTPLPNSTTLDEADVFGRTLQTLKESPPLDPSDPVLNSRIETISPKTEIKPDPKPFVVINPEPSNPEMLVNETTQREANIAASYLAEGTRERGESSPIAALKLQLSTNGFGAESQQNEPDQKQAAANKDVSGAEFQPLKMMTTGNVVMREGSNESPVTQTVSHILQVAEATPPKQSRTVRLRLRPEELGQVDVQLSRDSQGRISAQLTVEHDRVRAVLAQSLEQLRDSLQRAGLEVDRLQVRAEVSSFSSGQGTNQQSQEESRVYQSSSLTNSNSSTETHAPQAKRVNDHKLISLSA